MILGSIAALREELNRIEDSKRSMEHIERFRQFGNITELSRRVVATLIKSISVYGGKDFQMNFRYAADLCGTDVELERAVV